MEKSRILIVDDSQSTLLFTKAALGDKYIIETAMDGSSALEIVPWFNPDLILLDVVMPGVSGMEVCRTLSQNKKYADIPIIMVTSLSDADQVKGGLEAGAIDYIAKPFQEIELDARVHSALKIRQYIKLLKKANVEKQQLLEELKELNATKDKFFSIIAHDLKSPLISLLSGSRLLSNDISSLDMEVIETVAIELKENTKKLFELLENLLDWSRMQMKRTEFNPVKLPLHALLFKTIQLLTEHASAKGIHIENIIAPTLEIYADKDMINSVFHNLISNAIKFTREGGLIQINAKQQDKMMLVTVLDTGIGMKQKKIDKLFKIDEHVTSPGTDGEKGTGLGLILCKEFIEKNGGRIRVESKVNEGSQFSFTLPVV
ncbi:hybrid sensor histidine kinase/response regulator [bacterium]|nr:hybrid sensor histidine kinase/response regulator [bacterium]